MDRKEIVETVSAILIILMLTVMAACIMVLLIVGTYEGALYLMSRRYC